MAGCLLQELKVGDYYLRLFLETGDASVATLREPARFFDALYRRVLRESAPNLKSMCLRGMARVYDKHHRTIGPFEDTDYMVSGGRRRHPASGGRRHPAAVHDDWAALLRLPLLFHWQLPPYWQPPACLQVYLLSTTTHAEVRDRLLLLLNSLAVNPINCEKMINPDCLELLVDLLTTAHTTDVEQRAMPVLKGGASLLLLTNAPPGADYGASSAGAAAGGDAAASGGGAAGGDGSATPGTVPNANPKESLKIWHYRAYKADLAPGEKAEKGPYSLQVRPCVEPCVHAAEQ